jgi:hypothetical protein
MKRFARRHGMIEVQREKSSYLDFLFQFTHLEEIGAGEGI